MIIDAYIDDHRCMHAYIHRHAADIYTCMHTDTCAYTLTYKQACNMHVHA